VNRLEDFHGHTRRNKAKVHGISLLICLALSVALLRPLIENLRYPLLTGWDTWNFLGLAKLITNNGGLVPAWDTLQLSHKAGRFYILHWYLSFWQMSSQGTGISSFWLIKVASVILYPALALALFVVAWRLFDRRVALLSLIFFLSLNQAYINSLNSLSQVTEMILYLAIVLALYRRRYAMASVGFGLTFWTHSFTPPLFWCRSPSLRARPP